MSFYFLSYMRKGQVLSPHPHAYICTPTPVHTHTPTYALCSASMQKVQKGLTCLNALKFMLLMKTQGLRRAAFLKPLTSL